MSPRAGSGEPGCADGAGATAKFAKPEGVAVDSSGCVFVADARGVCVLSRAQLEPLRVSLAQRGLGGAQPLL